MHLVICKNLLYQFYISPFITRPDCMHHSDVTRSAMASQITVVLIVCSAVCSGAHKRKHQSSVLLAFCEGNPPVTGGFPSQRASNVENISIWWHHHGISCIQVLVKYETCTPCIITLVWFDLYLYKVDLKLIIFNVWSWHSEPVSSNA